MLNRIKKCKRCGELYADNGNPYCLKCLKELDELFLKIKAYIYENPDATAKQLVDEMEIDPEIITYFLRKGRLQLKNTAGALLRCRQCGKPITEGEYCKACSTRFSKLFKKSAEETAKEQVRMHTFTNPNKRPN